MPLGSWSRFFGSFVFVTCATRSSQAGPPPIDIPAPGKFLQHIESRNLGPFVTITTRRFGGDVGGWYNSVVWFNPDGSVRRELSGPRVDSNRLFVSESKNPGSQIVHGVHEDWHIELSNKGAKLGFITATPDSRVFQHTFHPEQRMIAVDVYLHGKLVGTVGPYHQLVGRPGGGHAYLSPEGHGAMLVRESLDGPVQIVVFDENAKILFVTQCDRPVISPTVTPQGDGVLLEVNSGERPKEFEFYQATGKVRSRSIDPNPHLLTWVPGTHKALFATSVGHSVQYLLFDWDVGETLWEIEDPCRKTIPALRSVVALAEYILTSGAEYRGSDQPVTIPTLYAINAVSGEVTAKWRPNFDTGISRDGGGLMQLQGKLYFVSDEYVSEINLEDMASKSNGWE